MWYDIQSQEKQEEIKDILTSTNSKKIRKLPDCF